MAVRRLVAHPVDGPEVLRTLVLNRVCCDSSES